MNNKTKTAVLNDHGRQVLTATFSGASETLVLLRTDSMDQEGYKPARSLSLSYFEIKNLYHFLHEVLEDSSD
ncbi:hypothetical protein ACQCN2_04750 [Brevibacillus ginsengisoli]|uniref:hypothetical protein n=1 Tax=Brevibacillus ginsengisoli TaxID=363854 RepID=UPI003CE6FDCD